MQRYVANQAWEPEHDCHNARVCWVKNPYALAVWEWSMFTPGEKNGRCVLALSSLPGANRLLINSSRYHFSHTLWRKIRNASTGNPATASFVTGRPVLLARPPYCEAEDTNSTKISLVHKNMGIDTSQDFFTCAPSSNWLSTIGDAFRALVMHTWLFARPPSPPPFKSIYISYVNITPRYEKILHFLTIFHIQIADLFLLRKYCSNVLDDQLDKSLSNTFHIFLLQTNIQISTRNC